MLCFEVLDEDDYSPAASKGSVVAFCGYVNLENWTWGLTKCHFGMVIVFDRLTRKK